jgi:ribosome recycling factor
MVLNQISNIQVVDARTVLIKPFDKSLLKDINTALSTANLGANPVLDSEFVKLSFPPSTEENRMKNVKKCKEILEQAKVRIRKVREDVKGQYKDVDGISEDVIFHFNEELDKITKLYNTKLEEVYNKKESELLKI